MYLSEKHLHEISKGCIFVSLGPDIQRQKPRIRALYEAKMMELFDVLAMSVAGKTAKDRVTKAQFVFSSMIGAVILARSMGGSDGATEILESTKDQLMKILN